MDTKSTSSRHLAKRLKAYCSNLVIILLLAFPVSYLLAVFISSWLESAISLSAQATSELTLVLGFVFATLIMAFPISRGQTKAVGLAVVGTDGRPLTYSQSLIRTWLVFLSSLPLGMGMWWAAIDEQGRTWADMAMGTKVILITDIGKNGNRQFGSDNTYVDKSSAQDAKCPKNLKGDGSPSTTGEKLPQWWRVSNGFGCLVVIIFCILCTLPTISHMASEKDKAKDDKVKVNMHTIQLAAEDFAKQAEDSYPINQTSRTPGGNTFKSIWPLMMKNPYNANDDAVVVLNKQPNWDEIKEGQVVYMPTGITKKGASGYVIVGKGKKTLEMKLISGE